MHGKPKLNTGDILNTYSFNHLKGVKVCFINMPLRESAMPNTPPEGPGILASILRKYGADPTIVDLNSYRLKLEIPDPQKPNGRHLTMDETKNLLLAHFGKHGDQDVIAFSGMITTLRWQEELAKLIKQIQPKTFLITGGGLGTELKRGLFEWIPELDGIAHSEGDDVIAIAASDAKAIRESGSVQRALDNGKLSPFYLGEMSSGPKFLYPGDRPNNLDDIPYAAWDLLEEDVYGNKILEQYLNVPVWGGAANNSSATSFTMNRSLTTVSSRGCPYSCAFCYRGAQGERNYGMRSNEHIAKQVKEYVDKYKVDFVGFPDDNFAISKKRLKDMPKVFKEYGLDIRWGTHTRLDEADDRLYDMSEAGCVYIGFGAESASAPVLERMKKGGFILTRGMVKEVVNGNVYEFPKTMFEGIQNCQKTNIHANCTWIMGYPGETLHDLKTSVAFIYWQLQNATSNKIPGSRDYEIAYQSVNQKMFTATAYPGTAMFKDQESKVQLSENFGLSFNNITGEPVVDDNFHRYVLELDDATKILHNKDGQPLNFSKMDMDTFLTARNHIDSGDIFKILEM